MTLECEACGCSETPQLSFDENPLSERQLPTRPVAGSRVTLVFEWSGNTFWGETGMQLRTEGLRQG